MKESVEALRFNHWLMKTKMESRVSSKLTRVTKQE